MKKIDVYNPEKGEFIEVSIDNDTYLEYVKMYHNLPKTERKLYYSVKHFIETLFSINMI